MKTFLLAMLLASASAVAAHAESFTFTATNTASNQVGGPMADGTPVAAGFSTGASHTTWASGQKSTTTSTCAVWTNAPGAQFPTSGVCDYSESTGDKVRLAFSCQSTNKEQTQSNCWGALSGMAGPHAGKAGTISFHTWGGAGSPSSHSSGAGVWPD
jgi:hypothetical protein